MKAKLQGVHPVLAPTTGLRRFQFYRRLGFEVSFQDSSTDARYAFRGKPGVTPPNQDAYTGAIRLGD